MHSNDNTHQHSVAVASFFTPQCVLCLNGKRNGGSALHCALLEFSSLQDSLASAVHFTILLHCTVSFCIVSYYPALACVAKWKREELVVNWRREGGWSEKAAELDAQMRNPRIRF